MKEDPKIVLGRILDFCIKPTQTFGVSRLGQDGYFMRFPKDDQRYMQQNLYFFPTMEIAFINVCFRKHPKRDRNENYDRQEIISNIWFELEDDTYEKVSGWQNYAELPTHGTAQGNEQDTCQRHVVPSSHRL